MCRPILMSLRISFAHFGLHIIGMIVGGGTNHTDRLVAGHGLLGDALGAIPGFLALHFVGDTVAGERELAGIATIGALIDDAADRLGIVRILDAVEHDFGHGELAKFRFGARFEIDRPGETVLLGKA